VIALLALRPVVIIQHPNFFRIFRVVVRSQDPSRATSTHTRHKALRLLLSASVPSVTTRALLGIRSRVAERRNLGIHFFTIYSNTISACVMKTNSMHYLSSVYLDNQPLHVSGIFVAHHQEVYCIYTTLGTCCAFQLTVGRPANGQSKDVEYATHTQTSSNSSPIAADSSNGVTNTRCCRYNCMRS